MVPRTYGRDAAGRPGDNSATAMKSVVVDWERAPSVGGRTYPTAPRSVVVLFATTRSGAWAERDFTG